MYAVRQYIQDFCVCTVLLHTWVFLCAQILSYEKKKKESLTMLMFIELFLLGIGLAMDAFAVSVCKGLGMRRLNKKQTLIIGLYFGGFQALMPLIGWLLGS